MHLFEVFDDIYRKLENELFGAPEKVGDWAANRGPKVLKGLFFITTFVQRLFSCCGHAYSTFFLCSFNSSASYPYYFWLFSFLFLFFFSFFLLFFFFFFSLQLLLLLPVQSSSNLDFSHRFTEYCCPGVFSTDKTMMQS